MFTINQIKQVHAKVKSGADFPVYIQAMKTLGVMFYEHYVSDGHIQYYGLNNFTASVHAKWATRVIAANGNVAAIKKNIAIHQQGQTDYPTFCIQAAQAGVDKWTVDILKMTCTYYDKAGSEMLVEKIAGL